MFVYFEGPLSPMHVGSVELFAGPIPSETFVRDLDAKLDALPTYR
jgi:hypothetical protein